MRIDEIHGVSAAEKRADRLKAEARAAKERARQLKVQADANAARVQIRKARDDLLKQQRKAVTTTIKPSK